MHIKRARHCKNAFSIVLLGAMFASLCACGVNNSNIILGQKDSSSSTEMLSPETDNAESESDMQENDIGSVTPGAEYYEGFLIDNILSFSDGTEELHYHVYLPEDYDGEKAYALYISLPGYGGYYFQGVGVNLRMESFASEAKNYVSDLIIVAPQPNDWGMTSANQTISLTKYLLSSYSIDPNRIYISGYSGGGETLSLVLGLEPQLFAAALHVSSQWDGEYEPLIQNRTPLYLVIGEADEYYGSEPARETYESFQSLYEKEGLSANEINEILVLDVKEQSYFTERGISNQHGGGGLIANDKEIMNWIFSKCRQNGD